MQEKKQAEQLVRMQRVATGLLVLMAVIFVAAKLFESEYRYLDFVGAFAEAAMVGALADWFAVTALFRSPLGLPIPHTAIIPRNKDRIGESLSDFLEHNFITQNVIREELQQIDFSGIAAAWLAQPENSSAISRQIVKAIPLLLHVVEDEDVQQFMHSRLAAALENIRLAQILAEVAALLVARRHHQALFDHLIIMAARALEHNKPYIRWKIHEASPRWLPKAIDDKLYERLLEAVQSALDEMKEDDSEWRIRFHKSTDSFIERLRTSPEYEARIDGMAVEIFTHPLFRNYMLDIWRDIKVRLEQDAESEGSQMVAKLDQAFLAFSRELLGEESMRSRLNQWIRNVAADAIVQRRKTIADLVARVIRQWDAETISRKLELHVGKDLQYIRINGTLVGGMVGLLLHLTSLAL